MVEGSDRKYQIDVTAAIAGSDYSASKDPWPLANVLAMKQLRATLAIAERLEAGVEAQEHIAHHLAELVVSAPHSYRMHVQGKEGVPVVHATCSRKEHNEDSPA